MKQKVIQPKTQYVLHPDVIIIPYTDLSEEQRTKTDINENEKIVTKKGGRKPSKVLNPEMVELVELFNRPLSYVEAISQFADKTEQKSDDILEGALPFIQKLLSIQFIISKEDLDQTHTGAIFKKDDLINEYSVEQCIQSFEDTEVYKAYCTKTSQLYALKIVKFAENKKAQKSLTREAELVKKLNGSSHALFVAEGVFENKYYFTTEWCAFDNIKLATKNLDYSEPEDCKKLLQISANVLGAFYHLHEQGCLHGDIYYKNILVNAESMNVKIIDFGRSYLEGVSKKQPVRAGVAHFFEPEHADAMLNKTSHPLTPAGEQFALAAVLYLIFTKKSYDDFSLEKEKMLRQISEAKPKLFDSLNKAPWPALEDILHKALSIDPSERYGDLAMMQNAIKSLDIKENSISNTKNDTLPDHYQNLLAIIQSPEEEIFESIHKAPKSSIVFGAAGVAYSLLKMAYAENCSKKMFIADIWANKAITYLEEDSGIYCNDLDLTPKVVPSASFYYGKSGVYIVQAMTAYSMGDEETYNSAINSYADIVDGASEHDQIELNKGIAGLLLGCCLLTEHTHDYNDKIISCGNRLYTMLADAIQSESKMKYYGIAHGWGGVYLSMMRWDAANRRQSHKVVPAGLSALLEKVDITEGCSVLPMKKSKKLEYVPWWCNGASGCVHLWLEAYEHLKDEQYLTAAIQAGEFVWQSSHNVANQDICCGQAGWGYSFLALYQATEDNKWLDRANVCANNLRQNVINSPFLFGTYKGSLGILLFLMDMQKPLNASMPLFTNVS